MEKKTRSLTVIPPQRVRHKRSRPDAHRYKEATKYRRDDAHDHNCMLLGRGIGVDCHGVRGVSERAWGWEGGDLVVWAGKSLRVGNLFFFFAIEENDFKHCAAAAVRKLSGMKGKRG